MIVGFTGSRFGMSATQMDFFYKTLALNCDRFDKLLHGGCVGADIEAEAIWLRSDLPDDIEVFPAHINEEWDGQWVAPYDEVYVRRHGIIIHPADYPTKRNKTIVDRCDVLFAAPAPNSVGTIRTMEYAWEKKVEVVIL